MKKFVLRLELEDNKEKRKALKTVSSLPGIDEISIDMKGKTLIVIGTVDPVSAASKLRKFWPTTILSVGPAKEPEPPKKEEPKKEEPKKDEPKKEEEPKKDEPKKDEQPPKKEGEAAAAAAAKAEPPKTEEKKPEPQPQPQPQPQPMVMPYRPYYHPPPMQQQQAYRPYYPPMQQTYYHMHHSIEENPNACVIS